MILKTITFAILVTLLTFNMSCSVAGTVDPELASLISNQNSLRYSSNNIDIIIEFSDKAPRSTLSTLSRKQIIELLQNKAVLSQNIVTSLLKSSGITIRKLWINNSIAASVPANLVYQIASTSKVFNVKLDKRFILESSGQSSPPAQNGWNITAIKADSAWSTGTTGQGIIIGTLDTGVDINHPDLSANWRGGGNSWLDPYGEHVTPHDSNGHGTQTTGLIIGGNSSGAYIGIAPDAQWISAKIFDDTNMASISAIHQAFQWMLDPDGNPDTDDNANIVNNSWNFGNSSNQCDYEFQDDISVLRSADIAVIFSSGNSGPNPATSESPANNEDTVPVGAIDELLNVALFSGRGPSACDDGAMYPTLVAPGVNVRTADLTFAGVIPNSYTYSSGTSFSAPHISGALALLQSKYPSSSLGARQAALHNTALLSGPSSSYGYGIIDIEAALQYLDPFVHPYFPSANIGENTSPTFSWSAVTGTIDYLLWLVDTSTGMPIYSQWHSASETNCGNGELNCSLTPLLTLDPGQYRWMILPRSITGNGNWSSVMPFSVGSTPNAAVLINPTANTTNNTPTFSWNAVTNSTDYLLWVVDTTTGIPLSSQWFSAAETGCDNGETICSIISPVTLADGQYRWMLLTKNIAGNGPWSTAEIFSVGTAPSATTLIGPSGNVISPVSFSWNSTDNTTDYFLWVVDLSTGLPINPQWYSTAETGCASGEAICSTSPTTTLSTGQYQWMILTRNAVGNGSWSPVIQFTIQ